MKNGSTQPYNVPLIPIDLRKEECVHQIADALDYLSQVANDVFTRIETRVQHNQQQLKWINDRVQTAQNRVDSLEGSKKATKVFSSAKYPSEDKAKVYESIFPGGQTGDVPLYSLKRPAYHLKSKHDDFDPSAMKRKLQFCNVHVTLKRTDKQEESAEGLGRLPRHVTSVSSLLLFNTSENPYKKYVMLDPLGVVTKTRSALEEEPTGLADAPSSIKHGDQMQRQQAENYFYVPDIGEVPEIAVPDFLPDLIGVADDLSYTADQGPSIAPSVFSTIPDLPNIVPEPAPTAPAASSSAAPPPPPGPPPPGPPPPPPPPGPGPAAPPPPPPPGPPPPPPPPPPVAPPPPPPPGSGGPPGPPPPPPPVTPASTPSGTAPNLPGAVTSPSSDRANLLEAIRRAGGKDGVRLKKVERKKEKAKVEVKASGGNDLMADLFNKLTMRRKGISGTKKDDQKSSDSGAVAPPPRPHADSGGAQDDDDWE